MLSWHLLALLIDPDTLFVEITDKSAEDLKLKYQEISYDVVSPNT